MGKHVLIEKWCPCELRDGTGRHWPCRDSDTDTVAKEAALARVQLDPHIRIFRKLIKGLKDL